MKVLSIFILLTFALLAKGQDKYKFMIIAYNSSYDWISVSIDGQEYVDERIKQPKHEQFISNANILLKKVKEFQDKDWELMNFNTIANGEHGGLIYFAYLRKKKEP